MKQNELTSRHVVATFGTYAEAERAVDSLADHGFPVGRLTIVAQDLRLEEHIIGRTGYGRTAFDSGLAGGLVGAALGFFFGLLSWVDPLISGLALSLYGFLLGAVIGVAFGLVTHVFSDGRRSFSSTGSISAASYLLLADDADEAKRAVRMLAARELQDV